MERAQFEVHALICFLSSDQSECQINKLNVITFTFFNTILVTCYTLIFFKTTLWAGTRESCISTKWHSSACFTITDRYHFWPPSLGVPNTVVQYPKRWCMQQQANANGRDNNLTMSTHSARMFCVCYLQFYVVFENFSIHFFTMLHSSSLNLSCGLLIWCHFAYSICSYR